MTYPTVKRALISVSDKKNLIELARGLVNLNIDIISTGGTSRLLREAMIPVRDVSEVTNFPEMMEGRLKTLHPNIHGGILGKRDDHAAIAKQHNIEWIDLVVVNLYPFAETIKNPHVTLNEAIENIDIGGPTMIRSAAKNWQWTSVVIDPNDYEQILTELNEHQGLTHDTRRSLATKAFQHTAEYDALIYRYLSKKEDSEFPEQVDLSFKKQIDLRYGENPHQKASAYSMQTSAVGVLAAIQHQGKPLSYNNIVDADSAITCVAEFDHPACVIVKHASPCGVAISHTISDAFHQAYEADNLSAFGGVIALNQTCDETTAKKIADIFFEVLIAPSYTKEALQLLASKQNLRVLELPDFNHKISHDYKFIAGGLLIQEKDKDKMTENTWTIVTTLKPNAEIIEALLFAWHAVKHVKSNAILIANKNKTIGIGGGQVSRIDAVEMAVHKAGNQLAGAVVASDAFFPFRDSIDRLANTGIHAIIQPGGSMRDQEVIDACDEHRLAMVFTGKRCFRHS